jgi:CheY-like chemotaxis protein
MAENTTRVLIVDDEHLIADTLLTILEQEGFSAHACYSGEEALKLCEELKPDILLCDVFMQGISGIELAIELTKKECKAKIVLISGRAATGDLLEVANRQGYDFEVLAKPVHPADLIQRLKQLL